MSDPFAAAISRLRSWADAPSDNLVVIHSIAADLKMLLDDVNLAVDITAAGRIKPLCAAMSNDDAWALGELCVRAAKDPNVGDYIDRGLILRRMLEEEGYRLVRKPRDWRAA